MDAELKTKWDETVKKIEAKFGEDIDIQAILFLIGVQELGSGPKIFGKDEKIELLHIAICRILSPFGYYELEGRDEDGWPHYKALNEIPTLKSGEQLKVMKEGIILYLEEEKLV
jgi:hypothetical protein